MLAFLGELLIYAILQAIVEVVVWTIRKLLAFAASIGKWFYMRLKARPLSQKSM